MTANELRIGNYLHDRLHRNILISEIRPEHLVFYLSNGNKIKHHINTFKPIPLTEEIVSKLKYQGFEIEKWEKVSVNEHEYFYRYVFYNVLDGTSNLEIHIIHSNYGNTKNIEFCLSIDKYDRQGFEEIKYLHQLQNGVYFLTQKELIYENRNKTS